MICTAQMNYWKLALTQWMTEHWLGNGPIADLLAAAGTQRLYRQQGQRRLDDFYVGGRKMGGLAIGISFFATFASTNSYIGTRG